MDISPTHIELLRTTFDAVRGINPSGSAYKNLVTFLDNLSKSSLKKLSKAKIKFVSPLAKNRLKEDWSDKYKRSIDCNNPKGFSQKAHCQGRKKQENKMSETIQESLNLFFEENKPTDPSKWAYYKAQAKKKFDVYPSAYANGWAAKQYKAAGGGWRKSKSESYDIWAEDGSFGYTMTGLLPEAEYQGRKVKLGKPMQGDVKKFKVYVKNPQGNVVKVNFGQGGDAKGGTMKIRKSNPNARKSFRARHNCDNPGPRHKARYWSCRKW